LEFEIEQSLYDRRCQLADLYNEEMDTWRKMILSRVETQEDRKQRIKDRAYALQEARNRNREEFVKACYTQQWRDACDDARTLDSKQLTIFMQRERVRQIEVRAFEKLQKAMLVAARAKNLIEA
jgi:DNA-directed RNA polymerase sigma subunit (sigma70/sigma32)